MNSDTSDPMTQLIRLPLLSVERIDASQELVLRGPEDRGAELETPKGVEGIGMGRRYPPPQPTRGSGVAS